ncbi:hypothetical protein RYZ20_11740 [Thioclava sp. A2]|uniref:hypothetical protein n=1 Tax=Thioclava sp. FCG-A2 TaxID=3080562 RepID=UPI002953A68E|nr:hypothetical protein [Thioclava sp. A2]MDV7271571.1 hypothetical protein [Thioclava sp. A2]
MELAFGRHILASGCGPDARITGLPVGVVKRRIQSGSDLHGDCRKFHDDTSVLHKPFLGKWLLFVAAWMWAVYLDDFLALDRVLAVPDGDGPHTVMAARPMVLLAVSWMAFEAFSRCRAQRSPTPSFA